MYHCIDHLFGGFLEEDENLLWIELIHFNVNSIKYLKKLNNSSFKHLVEPQISCHERLFK